MITSFILIKTRPGKKIKVCSEFKKMPEIKECYQLSSEYDIIAKIDTDNFNKIGQIIMEKIRYIQNVIDIKTLPGLY